MKSDSTSFWAGVVVGTCIFWLIILATGAHAATGLPEDHKCYAVLSRLGSKPVEVPCSEDEVVEESDEAAEEVAEEPESESVESSEESPICIHPKKHKKSRKFRIHKTIRLEN